MVVCRYGKGINADVPNSFPTASAELLRESFEDRRMEFFPLIFEVLQL